MKTKRRMPQPPKGSWLDRNGQRWIKIFFDVMSGFGGGEKFLRQVGIVFPMFFSFELGQYVVDMNVDGLQKKIQDSYPTLKRYSNLHFEITSNKILQR